MKQSTYRIPQVLFASALAISLAGCGGGGSSAVSNVSPEGLWSGTSSAGYTVNAFVLDNNEVWSIYTANSIIYGAAYGAATVDGSSITVSGTDFSFLLNQAFSGSYTGTVSAQSSMTLTSATSTVTLAYEPQYTTPATAAAIAGTWTYFGRSTNYQLTPNTFTIDSSGNFTITEATCTTTGSFVPRPGGKWVYDLSLTSTGSLCAVPGAASGVGYLNTSATPNQFVAMGLNTAKSDGLVVVGNKQ